jgi:hypothetical protein
MKIISFILNKVLIERKNPIKGKLEIKSGLHIADITKESNPLSDKDSLRFDFIFTVGYTPDIAQIEIKGSLITLDEKDESKEILKDWKDKKIQESIRLPIINFIMEKCTIKAIELEEEMGLPIHLPMPKLSLKPTEEKEGKSKKEKEKNLANYAG